MSEVMGVVLASPQFLFIQEASRMGTPARRASGKSAQPTVSHDHQLGDHELAIRLSYFLWSGPPDAELYRRAKEGTLSQPKVLHAQVERMLNDSRAGSFVEGFAAQWADLERFDAITVVMSF
jgi:hypothetical protein